MQSFARLGVFLPLLFAAPPLYAENNAPSAGTLDPLVVTATRTSETVDDTLSSVTLISRQDIERSQAQSMFDLLRGQMGLDVSSVGGPGQPLSVFLRGTNSDHVLVLVDGVKVGSATTGTAALQDIPLELIDHVEIVRGPRSSLFGSEAVGGVIQIFTKQGATGFAPTLSAGLGSYGTTQGSATVTGQFSEGKGWYSAGLSGFDTRGIPACQGNLTTTGCPTVTNSPIDDGYHNQSGRLRAGWNFDNGAQADLNWIHTQGASQYVGNYTNQSHTSQNILSATLSTPVTANWKTSLRLGQSQDNSQNLLNGSFVDRYDTTRDTMNWQNEITLASGQTLIAGVDQQNDLIDSNAGYLVNSRTDTGVFVQYLGKFGAQNVELSTRRDINQQFGTWTTGSAAWGWALSDALRFVLSDGTAFKAPTFNQMYYPYYGNPLLRPEQSNTFETGLDGKTTVGRWSVHAFQTRIHDLIDTGPNFTAVNIDQALIRGLESRYSTQWMNWSLQGSLDLLDPSNRTTGPLYGSALPQRAPQSGTLNLDRSFQAWSAGATLRAESARNDFSYLAPNYAQQLVRMGGFATMDVRTEYKINPQWRLQGRLDNLLNKNYETAYPYNQLGRGLYVTLRYQPQSL